MMRTATTRRLNVLALLALAGGFYGLAEPGSAEPPQQQDPLAQPFKGITTNGTVVSGLFPLRRTGVSTRPVREAAEQFLAVLSEEQRTRTRFAADDPEWRRWNNVHRYARAGVNLRELTPEQRGRAHALLRAGLSAVGYERARDVMRLNGFLADVVNNHADYGEDLYHFTVMGEPSDTEPWGWQLDGHHLIINYFILGDQVVMTPTFLGSEPVSVDTGKYAGIALFTREQDRGVAFFRSLTPDQRAAATIRPSKPGNNALAQAFTDNLVLDYAGLRAAGLSAAQQRLLLDIVAEYVGNMPEGHARVRMDEVRAHLADTYFAWAGDDSADGVFYYRIQSPVILIEFDHQNPVALPGPRVPTRSHVHTVVRTPNGNDYGKDLLRQHYAAHRDDPAHGHRH